MRRGLLIAAAASAAVFVFMLVGPATAAHSRVARFIDTPQSRTSDTKAVFKWTAGRGAVRTLCRLRWRPLPGRHSQRTGIGRTFRRCHSPETLKHLTSG